MAGSTASPSNTADRNLDGLLDTNTTALLKAAVTGTSHSVSGSDTNAASASVGTNAQGATPVSTNPIVVIGGLADDTSPSSVTEGQVGRLRMSLSGLLKIAHTADAASLSSVASTDSSTTIIAANANRIGLIIFNDDSAILYLKYGATASTSSYTVQIPGGGYWEMPVPVYRGAVDGIWVSSGSGSARITELT